MESYEEIVQKWRQHTISSAEDVDAYLENFRILFAYHSNKIENPQTTYHNTREIFENGSVINYTGDMRTLFEIQNQKECYDFLKEKIVKKEPLTQQLILDIHGILMHGCYDEARCKKGERPGSYKRHMYVVGDDIGVECEDVPNEIQYILDEVSSADKEDALTAAAYLHLYFESVHPFADGNGRVGRTLMNYFLLINGHPPVILYEEDKATYYMALAVFDKTGKLDGFIQFLKEETIKTWNKKKPIRISLKK